MDKIIKLAFGTDHAAAEVRNKIKEYFQSSGYEIEDFGFCGEGSCDYPDYALKVAEAVVGKKADKGVLICGTGIGMSVAANKVKGVIAAVCWDEDTAKLAAQHNGANILCLGSRTATLNELCRRIKIFLETPFEKRHSQRIKKIREIEKLQCQK
ncbi:ribose 5-phosphate isomerase B [Candidatus Endomicrobiellum agilis]|jgi:ribose 5-phosphate isomerase B|uniref:ribose 5-phosphate isomerase B n=1 Tax=Candidatus Endomicrobiellum agilis TaxID=3238957 RepID=UPI00284568C5|nr:ribose 5-phosphate isomerase B [Endomicrobium sp.]MCA6084792.1 ribose 5-phosphate isomerase B [Endomicrobium sp.]MDR3092719.1 ribose 5-phosphate isomerase B [Endomicrobium sp.]